MTDKEQIIIDGEKEDCKILFRCKHIDDLAAYNMIRNGIKITPENAPIGDFELMLIENTDSPFGFSSVCKRNNKEDVWEYSGFGHSGACSIVTALLKRLARKTQECEQIKEKYEALKLENQEGYEIVAELKHEYEGLKKQLETAEEWRIKAESLNEKLELKNTYYLEALDEIEKELKEDIYCESQECGCDDFEECLKCTKEYILDIINKAKGEEDER